MRPRNEVVIFAVPDRDRHSDRGDREAPRLHFAQIVIEPAPDAPADGMPPARHVKRGELWRYDRSVGRRYQRSERCEGLRNVVCTRVEYLVAPRLEQPAARNERPKRGAVLERLGVCIGTSVSGCNRVANKPASALRGNRRPLVDESDTASTKPWRCRWRHRRGGYFSFASGSQSSRSHGAAAARATNGQSAQSLGFRAEQGLCSGGRNARRRAKAGPHG